MTATNTAGLAPFQAAERELGQVLSDRANVVDQISFLSNTPPGMNGCQTECTAGLGTCAICQIQLREELATFRDRERGKAEYTRMLVHELRAPVTASRSLAAALRHVHSEDTQVNEVLGRIEKRMDQLLDLVDDILHLNRIKAGQSLGEVVDCDLVTETRHICEPYFEEAAVRGLVMESDLPASPVAVFIARQDYQLILSNLVSNAVKYTTVGGVEITLRQEDSWAVLEVRDTGIGIPAGEVAQLFTEFFRASNARRSRVPGTGLGLAGVRALVERYGGELLLESKENHGSKFTVRLPLHRSQSVPLLSLSGTESHVHYESAFSNQTANVWAA